MQIPSLPRLVHSSLGIWPCHVWIECPCSEHRSVAWSGFIRGRPSLKGYQRLSKWSWEEGCRQPSMVTRIEIWQIKKKLVNENMFNNFRCKVQEYSREFLKNLAILHEFVKKSLQYSQYCNGNGIIFQYSFTLCLKKCKSKIFFWYDVERKTIFPKYIGGQG